MVLDDLKVRLGWQNIAFASFALLYHILYLEPLEKSILKWHNTSEIFFLQRLEIKKTNPTFFRGRSITTHTTYSKNNMCQKCGGNCGLWIFHEIIQNKYAESLKKIVGAFWELPAK